MAAFYGAVKWGYVVPAMLGKAPLVQKRRKRLLLALSLLCFGSGSISLAWNAPTLSSEFPYLMFASAVVALVYDKSGVAWTPSVIATVFCCLNILRFGDVQHMVVSLIMTVPSLYLAVALSATR